LKEDAIITGAYHSLDVQQLLQLAVGRLLSSFGDLSLYTGKSTARLLQRQSGPHQLAILLCYFYASPAAKYISRQRLSSTRIVDK